ncbi:hypothetical protein GF323_00155 [Candidatus Woesearchaeota archaeon]|nr:hypothetical protein [Candidatus Woesearchaeota archaeon]
MKQAKINYAHEIQQIFRYRYRNEWVSHSFINQHDRLWIQAFNSLVRQGFIERKKTINGHKYRWKAAFPEI